MRTERRSHLTVEIKGRRIVEVEVEVEVRGGVAHHID